VAVCGVAPTSRAQYTSVCIPKIYQIENFRFLGISRHKFTCRFWFNLNFYREILESLCGCIRSGTDVQGTIYWCIDMKINLDLQNQKKRKIGFFEGPREPVWCVRVCVCVCACVCVCVCMEWHRRAGHNVWTCRNRNKYGLTKFKKALSNKGSFKGRNSLCGRVWSGIDEQGTIFGYKWTYARARAREHTHTHTDE